ncbi:DUF3392 domain-containing protein [Vibrio sp. TH_r3]|uniref:DUF3392 domain-containing protein n=1 Tax=Vibrio sp. TH_r3 TaxID=3082084 RepID=UPI0029555907|nr:DUF3392 domain-containing protein [Vibrio sp. TH_r3]MDV7104300.1 DUF3392 domain-containing protein [Vibrio sp. TH_r3]
MLDFFSPLGSYLIPYVAEISVAFIACMLVILGGDINHFTRRKMVRQHFIVRTLAFILLNAFGYGLIIIKVSPYLARWLKTLDSGILFISVIICFIVIGMWAQKNRHV